MAGWSAAKGLDVTSSPDSEADRIIGGRRVEIKFSTPWSPGWFYKFQQIRDQNYEYVVCLGVEPFSAQCWVIPKSVLEEYVIGKMGQHGGQGARDTDWLTVYPTHPPDWLGAYGGTLAQAFEVLSSF